MSFLITFCTHAAKYHHRLTSMLHYWEHAFTVSGPGPPSVPKSISAELVYLAFILPEHVFPIFNRLLLLRIFIKVRSHSFLPKSIVNQQLPSDRVSFHRNSDFQQTQNSFAKYEAIALIFRARLFKFFFRKKATETLISGTKAPSISLDYWCCACTYF